MPRSSRLEDKYLNNTSKLSSTTYQGAIDELAKSNRVLSSFKTVIDSLTLESSDPVYIYVNSSSTTEVTLNLPSSPNTEKVFIISNISASANLKVVSSISGSTFSQVLFYLEQGNSPNYLTAVWDSNAWKLQGPNSIEIIAYKRGVQTPPKVTGVGSVAIGNNTLSSSSFSTSIGSGSQTTSAYSASFGFNCKATGTYTLALGGACTASGERSICVGVSSEAYGNNSISIGYDAVTNGEYAIAVGTEAVTNYNQDITIGYNSKINTYTSSINYGSSIVIGPNSQVTRGSISFGKNLRSNSSDCVVLGINSTANQANSIVIGKGATTNAVNAVQIGPGTNTSGSSLQFGSNNIALSNTDGVRTSFTNPSSYTPLDTDNVTSHLKAVDTAIGVNKNKVNDYLIKFNPPSVKQEPSTLGGASFAIGNNATTSSGSTNGFAIGNNSLVGGNSGTAIGFQSQANNLTGVALGANAVADASQSTSIGPDSKVYGDQGVAVGRNSKVGVSGQSSSIASNSIAIGTDSLVTTKDSVQLGKGTNNSSSTLQFLTNTIANEDGLYTSFSNPTNYSPSKANSVTSHLQSINLKLPYSNSQTGLDITPVETSSNTQAGTGYTFPEDLALNDVLYINYKFSGDDTLGGTATHYIGNSGFQTRHCIVNDVLLRIRVYLSVPRVIRFSTTSTSGELRITAVRLVRF